MSFTPIQSSDFHNKCVTELADQPTLSATALKQRFDAPARDVVAPAVNQLISDLESATAAQSIGAIAPYPRSGDTVQGVLNSISEDLEQAENAIDALETDSHTHDNKDVLDLLSDNTGDLYYDGNPIGETDYEELDNLPQINGVTLKGDKSTADLGIIIPEDLADLNDDSTHRLVTDTDTAAWNAKPDASVKNIKVGANTIVAGADDTIEFKPGANVTIVANTSDKSITITSTGGGGGGGGGDMYQSVYDTNADGVVNEADTATTLTGLTASITELNYVDGVTSPIQTQINNLPEALSELSDVDFTTPPTLNQTLKYDGTKWIPGLGGGHAMKPDPGPSVTEDAVVSAVNGAQKTNDEVASLFGIQRWTNVKTIRLMIESGIGHYGVGEWQDTIVGTPTKATETGTWGWYYNENLKKLADLTKNGYDYELAFKFKSDTEVVTLGGYILDTDTGCICIRFANYVIDTANTKIAVDINIVRNDISYIV